MGKKILFLLGSILFFLSTYKEAGAAINCPFTAKPIPSFVAPVTSITLSFKDEAIQEELKNYPSGGDLKWSFPGVPSCRRPLINDPSHPEISISNDGNPVTRCDDDLLSPGIHNVEIVYEWPGGTEVICATKSFTIEEKPSSCQVEARFDSLGDVDDTTWRIAVWDIVLASRFSMIEAVFDNGKDRFKTLPNDFERNISPKIRTAGFHTATIYGSGVHGGRPIRGKKMCATTFEVAPRGATPQPTVTPGGPTTALLQPKLQDICKQVSNNPNTPQNEKDDCIACVTRGHAYTAIGCLPTNVSAILKDYLFPIGLGIAGGIAFLLILLGGFTILTSAGNPEQIAKGKELITSALAGLLLIIFSVFILRLIGVDILRIPGFR